MVRIAQMSSSKASLTIETSAECCVNSDWFKCKFSSFTFVLAFPWLKLSKTTRKLAKSAKNNQNIDEKSAKLG